MSQATSRNPVVLVHGIDDTQAIFWKMAPYLRSLGHSVFGLDLIPNDGLAGLDVLGRQVANFINRTFPPHQPIDLVGFSMGGIISRYYVQRLGGMRRVQRLVTIASPHQGTWAAYTRPNLGCNQMRPGSRFLRDLHHDITTLDQINVTSIWTPLDLIILPANSSELPIGKNIQVWVGGHAWMVTDPKSLETVADALIEPLRKQHLDWDFGAIAS